MRKRPAEATTAAVGTAGLAAAILAHNWLAAALAAVAYIPAAITLVVAHGGLRGALRVLWAGSDPRTHP